TEDMAKTLEPGDLLPVRRLQPLGGGPPVRIGSNQSRAQVLVLTHSELCERCTRYLESFEDVLEAVRNEKARVLALVGPKWSDEASDLPVPAVVVDEVLRDALSADKTPVVAVVDRFGQLFAVAEAGDEHCFPEHHRILSALLDIGIRCPECGVPDVPSPELLPEEGTRSGGMLLGQ
ncbi:MAG: hypothetical protein M3314_13390, partial [Actinomycetota bacterium]|nr:hypothetical protein [Actinomycetota bacterium]